MSATAKILEDLRHKVTLYGSNIRAVRAKENLLFGYNNIPSKDKFVLFKIKEEESYKSILEDSANDNYNEAHRLFDRHKEDFNTEELREAEELMAKLESE